MRLGPLMVVLATASAAHAAEPPTILTIKDHRFAPPESQVRAGQAFRLQVINGDPTAEEFECEALHIERDIAPHGKLVLQLGPLPAGDYAFVGDLHADTARGVLHVVAPVN